MFQNSTRIVINTTDTVVDLLDLIRININSLTKLSEAGNAKAELVLDASHYDVAAQRIDLEAKIKALGIELNKPTPKPKK